MLQGTHESPHLQYTKLLHVELVSFTGPTAAVASGFDGAVSFARPTTTKSNKDTLRRAMTWKLSQVKGKWRSRSWGLTRQEFLSLLCSMQTDADCFCITWMLQCLSTLRRALQQRIFQLYVKQTVRVSWECSSLFHWNFFKAMGPWV